MANIKIPDLPLAVSLTGTEEMEIVQPPGSGGTSKRTTTQAIANLAAVEPPWFLSMASGRYPDVSAMAIAGWESDTPIILGPGETATLPINLTTDAEADTPESRHQLLMELALWQSGCLCMDDARLTIRLANGYYTVSAWNALGTGVPVIYREANSPVLDIRGASSAEMVIESITYATPSVLTPAIYPTTVGVTTNLPAYVVPGYALGARNVRGNNDAAALNGALRVLSVALDRRSFTANLVCHRTAALVSPSIIDTSTTYQGMVASRIVVPSACLGINTAYVGPVEQWTGADHEGYFNIVKGGRMEVYNLGLCWIGQDVPDSDYDQDLIFVKDAGSTVYTERVAFAGAGDKVLRGYGGGEITVNQSCIGGGGTAQQGISVQAASDIQAIRTCVGGFERESVALGDGSHATITASIIGTGTAGVYVSGANAGASVLSATVTSCLRGLYAVSGTIQVGSSTLVQQGTVSLDWLANGFIVGDVDPTALATNVSNPNGNVSASGGGWYQDITKGLANWGSRVSLPNNNWGTMALSGVGGRVSAACETIPQGGFILDIDITSPGTIFVAVYAGSEVVIGSGNLTPLPVNPGKTTVSVYLDGSTYKLVILNEDGANRAWRLQEGPGELTLGTAVVTS